MAAKLTPITGQVLDHALQDAQISRRDAADRLGVSVADLDAWIRETRAPNAGQFGYGHLYDEHGDDVADRLDTLLSQVRPSAEIRALK
jgi:DNA-binding transcriptional regulator YiaG